MHVLLCLLLSLTLWPYPVAAKTHSLFGHDPIKTYPSSFLTPWQNVLKRHAGTQRQLSDKDVTRWHAYINSIRGETKLRQMMLVDQWFRQFNYKLDNVIYKQNDYWTSPYEFLTKGGDCEDYAIIKYMSLRELGFSADTMKIAMVYDHKNKRDHSVLIVEHDNAEFVLDTDNKITVDRYAKAQYTPHFAFNENNVWMYDSPLIADYLNK